MALRDYSSKTVRILCLGSCLAAIFAISSCAGVPPSSAKPKAVIPEPAPAPAIIEKPAARGIAPDSRTLASRSLTDEGAGLLKDKNFDGAIRVLERAVGVNPQDGPAYYFLAEAWIGKNDPARAAQFNDLAALYLRSDKKWSEQVRSQRKRIDGR
jgi:hypothetical protein